MTNNDEIEVVDLEEYLLNQGINPYLEEVEVVDLEEYLLAQGINPYLSQEDMEGDILLDEITLDDGTKRYVDHATFREYNRARLRQAELLKQKAARYRESANLKTNIYSTKYNNKNQQVLIDTSKKQEQAKKTSKELSETLEELRNLTKSFENRTSSLSVDSNTSEKKYKYIGLNGSISYLTADEFNVQIIENIIQIKRNNADLRRRRLERKGKLKSVAETDNKKVKSSREVAREILSKIKQNTDDENRSKKENEDIAIKDNSRVEYEVSFTGTNLMVESQKILDSENASIEDLSNFVKAVQENNPLKKYEDIDVIANINEKKEKKKKSKKNYFKKVALAASVVLGLILPGKTANRYESNVVKNTTIESQKNQNEKINVQPKEVKNNNGNKIVINKKIVNKTLKSKIKLKDNITLRKATFHYSSTGVGPKVSQSNIPCDSYSIEKFAILSHDNELIDTIDIDEKNKNMSIDDLKANIKSVYGKDVKIKMNVTGIEEGRETYPNIGWTSINKVSGTAKAYSKKR